MIIVLIFVAIISLSLFFINKKTNSPALLIFLWYGVFAVISLSGMFGMAKPTIFTVLFLLFNVFIICLISSTVKPSPREISFQTRAFTNGASLEKEWILLKILRLLFFVINLVFAINLVTCISRGILSFNILRLVIFQSEEYEGLYSQIFFSKALFSFYDNFLRGYFLFDYGLSLSRSIVNKKSPSVISILNMLLFCLIELSRIELLRMLIILIIIIIFSGGFAKSLKWMFKNKAARVSLLIFVAFGIAVVAFRNYQNSSFVYEGLKNVIGDASGPFVTFDYVVGESFGNGTGIETSLTNFVESLFGGLSSIFTALTNSLFGASSVSANTLVNNYTGYTKLDIGLGYQFNAFYTMFCPSFLTGGFIGCLFYSVLVGIVLKWASTTKYNNVFTFWRFSYIVMIVMFGLFNYQLQSIASWVAFSLTLLVCILKPNSNKTANSFRRAFNI